LLLQENKSIQAAIPASTERSELLLFIVDLIYWFYLKKIIN